MAKKKKSSSIKPVILIIVAIVVIFVAVSVFSAWNKRTWQGVQETGSTEGSNENTQNTVKERNCREVQEPYTDEVCERVPYEATEEYDYYPTYHIVSNTIDDDRMNSEYGFYATGTVELRNTDNDADWYNVVFNWETLEDEHTDTVRHYIEPDEVVEFFSLYDIDMGEDITYTINVNPDPITKTKTVTRYRQECHTVTKYRTKTVCD